MNWAAVCFQDPAFGGASRPLVMELCGGLPTRPQRV
jgi:hypothetical protein